MKLTWENNDNIDYYENIPAEVIRDTAIRGGLEDGCDVDIIYPFIESAESLIEPGAGYGRAIKRLIEKGFKGKVFALERSKNFLQFLKSHFADKVSIMEGDTKYFIPEQKFDVVIGMWSHLSEFPKKEQPFIVKHLASWLNPNGLLILETISHALTPKNATSISDSFFVIDTEYGRVQGHTPSPEEVKDYVKMANLKFIKQIDYKTTANRSRVIYIISNSQHTMSR